MQCDAFCPASLPGMVAQLMGHTGMWGRGMQFGPPDGEIQLQFPKQPPPPLPLLSMESAGQRALSTLTMSASSGVASLPQTVPSRELLALEDSPRRKAAETLAEEVDKKQPEEDANNEGGGMSGSMATIAAKIMAGREQVRTDRAEVRACTCVVLSCSARRHRNNAVKTALIELALAVQSCLMHALKVKRAGERAVIKRPAAASVAQKPMKSPPVLADFVVCCCVSCFGGKRGGKNRPST